MKRTGVIFCTSMVKALKNGKKATRRTRGLEYINKEPDKWTYRGFYDGKYFFEYEKAGIISLKCPFGGKGDELIVREKWATISCEDNTPPSSLPPQSPIWFEDTPGDEP